MFFNEGMPRAMSDNDERYANFLLKRRFDFPTPIEQQNMDKEQAKIFQSYDATDYRENFIEPYLFCRPEILKGDYEKELAVLIDEIKDFTQPLTPLRAKEWFAELYWTQEQAAALWKGVVPRPGLERWARSNRFLHDDCKELFWYLDHIKQGLEGGFLKEPIAPAEMLKLAAQFEPFDPALFPVTEPAEDAQLTHSSQQRNFELEAQLAKRRKPSPSQKELNDLLQMFAAVCLKKYNFSYDEQRSKSTKNIADAIRYYTSIFDAHKEDDSGRRHVVRKLIAAKSFIKQRGISKLGELKEDD